MLFNTYLYRLGVFENAANGTNTEDGANGGNDSDDDGGFVNPNRVPRVRDQNAMSRSMESARSAANALGSNGGRTERSQESGSQRSRPEAETEEQEESKLHFIGGYFQISWYS